MRVFTCLKLIVLGVVLIALGTALRAGVRVWQEKTAPEQLRAMLYEQIAGALEANVDLGRVSFTQDGLLCAENLALRLPGEAKPFFSCRQLLIAVDKLQLVRLHPVIEKVTVIEPELDLSYSHATPQWNVEQLRVRRGPGRAAGEAPAGLLCGGIALENATVTVHNEPLFGDAMPRVYEGLYLDVQPERSLQSWHVEGSLRRGLLSGTTLRGWVWAGRTPEFSIDVSTGRLQADEAVWHLVPQGRTVWRQYEVRGLLACQGTVRQLAGDEVRMSFGVDVIKAALRVPFYPVTLTDVHGLVHVTEREAVLQGCTGLIAPGELDDPKPGAPPPQVRISGTSSLTGDGGTFCIEVLDVPLGPKTVKAIPDAGPQIWERLAPSGQARLLLTVCQRPSPEAASFSAVVDLADATLNLPELPLPLRKVGGRLVVDGRTAHLNNLTGLIVQDREGEKAAPSVASFALDGVLDLQRQATRLKLTLNNLRSDEGLVKAIPGVGPGVWEMFAPEVILDVTALLSDDPGRDEMAATVLLGLHGGTARPTFLPMPLNDVCGALRVENGKVFLEHVTAVIDTDTSHQDATGNRSMVELHGVVLPESGEADVYVAADNVALTESLLSAVPTVGKRVWEEARPKGIVSARGRIRHDPKRSTPSFLLKVPLEDVSVLPRFLPIPVDALAGQLLLTEEQATSNDFSGVACGGQFQGAAVAYYGEGVALPSYGAQLQYSQVELRDLVKAVTGQTRDVTGRLTGALAISGLAGDPMSTAGRGVVSLSDGRLWRTPFFAQLLSVLRLSPPPGNEATMRGEASFELRGDTVIVREFEVTGSGLNLTGYGEVMLDGRLNLMIVAAGAPEKGGIPILTPLMGWLLQFVERELVQLHVTGTIGEPSFQPTPLAAITQGFTWLPHALLSPFLSKEPTAGTVGQ